MSLYTASNATETSVPVRAQATVQAALSPRDAVNGAYGAASTSAEAVQYREWANETLTIAVFEILIAATIGTLLIRISAPKLLARVSHCPLSCATRSKSHGHEANRQLLTS